MRRKIRLILPFILFIPLALVSQDFTKIFPTDRSRGEGKTWIHWDESQRKGFVLGYVWGLDRGFHNGCLALSQISPSPSSIDHSKGPDLLDNPSQHCMSQLPVYSKALDYYETQITKFYETYPQDQDLPLRQLFSQLEDSSNNKTLEQIHSWYHTPG